MKLNEAKFLESVQKIHLKLDEVPIYSAISDAKARKKLDDFIDCGENSRFSQALDEICENIVGKTMFRVLMAKTMAGNVLKSKGKIKIKDQYERDKGSRYSPGELAVKINPDFYELDGTGKPERKYYGINEKVEIETKLKSMVGSIFHEFCHVLHDISGTDFERNEFW
jgi:hypothetical protein